MKTHSPTRKHHRSRPALGHRRGAALIIVLAILVLVSALIVAFLGRTSVERTASASYDASSRARLLSDTAVNLVQAAINEASSTGGTTMWASQPGAIRVYDNTGDLQTIYRLYSAATLSTDTDTADVLANDLPPANWAQNTAEWVDLNAPVIVPASAGSAAYSVYPVLDPRDPTDAGQPEAPKLLTDMEGFAINSAPGATTLQPAPMPVRWLYVLEAGQIVPGTTGNGKTVSVPGATKANPVVGRIAYWTDDDTSKVNINTAGGSQTELNDQLAGVSWDIPRFKILDELKLYSQNQPVHMEYQRYPGHPASTSLYGIVASLGMPHTGYPYEMSGYGGGWQSGPTGQVSDLYAMLPRYTDKNSSMGGTANTTKYGQPEDIPKIEPVTDRLFSSVSELIFDPDRSMRPGLSRQQVETGKFFLTAQSRAPEVNLFGTPRISVWPISTIYASNPTSDQVSAFDRLIAFCASTTNDDGTHPYYIQRADSTSPTKDYDNIPRNQDLYAYLQRLTSTQIPGFSGTFAEKYDFERGGALERDQILTEMVDYIRSTNLYDHSIKDPSNSNIPRYTPSPNPGNGANQVVPLQIGKTRGLGRMYTISEVALQVIATADGNSGTLNHYKSGAPLEGYQPAVKEPDEGNRIISPMVGSLNSPSYVSNLPVDQYLRDTTGDWWGWEYEDADKKTGYHIVRNGGGPFPANPTLPKNSNGDLVALSPGQKRLQAMLLVELHCPMLGHDYTTPNLQINIRGMDNIEMGTLSATVDTRRPFPSEPLLTTTLGTRLNIVQQTGGLNSFHYFMSYVPWSGQNRRARALPGEAQPSNPYNFISDPWTVVTEDNGQGDLELTTSGGSNNGRVDLDVQVKQKGTPNYQTVQTFDLEFPRVVTPMPDLIQTGTPVYTGSTVTNKGDELRPSAWWGFENRVAWLSSDSVSSSFNNNPPQSKGAIIRMDPNGTVAPGVVTSGWKPDFIGPAIKATYYRNVNSTEGPKDIASDVVRSLVAKAGDARLVMVQSDVVAGESPDAAMVKSAGYDSDYKLAHSLMAAGAANFIPGVDLGGKLVPDAVYSQRHAPKVPSNEEPLASWDWDTGMISHNDGAYANKPDEGNIYTGGTASPYYNAEQAGDMKRFYSYFTANRIIPSAVMFGSLPTGAIELVPWRTLLFRPAPAGSRPRDPAGPKDYLLLDLFSMPVVEPYAISEPFSTAGKINMNYQIVPFTYLKRDTGVRAVLGSELIARVHKVSAESMPGSNSQSYLKSGSFSQTLPGGAPDMKRLPIDLDETLKQFDERFDSWDIFRSASEICDIYLVPEGYGWPNFETAWYGDDFAMVGDNVRERPYAHIYPRLTTKSNSYTVHYKVQALKANPGMPDGAWDEARGTVIGEYRGSTSLERFLDPNNPNIPDYAADPSAPALDNYYQWRVVANDSFAP